MRSVGTERKFLVCFPLPASERGALEAARKRLGLRSWGAVALLAWRRLQAELEAAEGGRDGGGNGEGA